MVVKPLPVLWDNSARASFRNIYNYIKSQAKSNGPAEMVKRVILAEVDLIPTRPRTYPLEPYLSELDGEFRFALVFTYKIIFEIGESQIFILDIFHTSRNPQEITELKK